MKAPRPVLVALLLGCLLMVLAIHSLLDVNSAHTLRRTASNFADTSSLICTLANGVGQYRGVSFSQRIQVFRFIVLHSILPTMEQDPDPLEGQCTQDGMV